MWQTLSVDNLTRREKMRTQNEIFEEMQNLIPEDLWEKYNHLSFGEMADEPELAGYVDELRQAETDWYEEEK
jgi:hypothetical protein